VIVGIGVDVCDVARIEQSLGGRTADRFRARVFTAEEAAYCDARGRMRLESYAAGFAAKEAVLKALGTGWADGLAWHEVEVVHDAAGAPQVALHGVAATRARRRGVTRVHLTLSHTGGLAVAVVVLEGRLVTKRTQARAEGGGAAARRPRSPRRTR
jgi:holo-[acyl-carrier protein] synthase